MRLRSWLLPAVLATPLLFPFDSAVACLRFKKPGGAAPPGLREPSDPPTPPPPTTTPTGPTPGPTPTTPTGGGPATPAPVSTPPAGGELTGGGGDGPEKKKQASDDSTWETWWALTRIEFFPHRYVKATTSSEGPVLRGVQPLAPVVVREKLWKPLMKLKDDKQVFVREAALITIGRVASDEGLRAEARTILLDAIKDPNHLVARAAALGLFYVADDSCLLPMAKLAENPKAEPDVRAFLALTLTAMKSDMAGPLLERLITHDKDADFDVQSAALMGLGYVDGPAAARRLSETYMDKKFRAELRAIAVESFGRRGIFADGF